MNDRPPQGGRFVLYWMQASQRAAWNPALQLAVARARELDLPVVAAFGLAAFPEASARHYAFMLEGLAETSRLLGERGIRLHLRACEPPELVEELGAEAALVVADTGYLRIQRRWRQSAAARCRAPLVAVEGEVVVPARLASGKEEWAARTIRPRIRRHLERFLVSSTDRWPKRDSLALELPGKALDPADLRACLDALGLSEKGARWPVKRFRGGPGEARRRLELFIQGPLARYHLERSDPGLEIQSDLGPYLHFGQISPVEVALAVRGARWSPEEAKEAFIEELVVRRELSANLCLYNDGYDGWDCLPDWARSTLEAHSGDPRPVSYAPSELEAARTHDELWNAAMREMLLTGKMHNYMRMYWGKKILEWSQDPRDAFASALGLNNRHSLDGRDPNSFAGVAWCFGKHDQAWAERPIFGKVRFMGAQGLRRKFDMDAYLDRVRGLEAAAAP